MAQPAASFSSDLVAPSRIEASGQIVAPGRIESVDIFRGFNVLLMILVDNLGLVKGLPWWTYHMPANANGMTYVDMVFPAFLFLMGMSIPPSMRSRIAKGETARQLWAHVLWRSFALIVMGLFVANALLVDAGKTGMNASLWAALGFVAIGFCLVCLPEDRMRASAFLTLRIAGIVLALYLALIFRRTAADGHSLWLDFSDWEILGLLGWAYLFVSAVYLLCRKISAFKSGMVASLLVLALAGFIAINVASKAGLLAWLDSLPPYLKPLDAGLSAITMAGLLASMILTGDGIASSLRQKLSWATIGAVIFFVLGWFLRPLGISKIRGTPTWCLYCMSASLVVVVLLYWFADVRRGLLWTGFARIVGANALLAYFLPYTAYLIAQLGWLTADGSSGWLGIGKSMFFTSLILAAVLLLNRCKIGLRV
ncbi:MAG TPA: DUF5009 domain-containing protein [Candidatus Angelobacter sp.]|nr:DUF5009 domain-containing protein [Candidatus Angelobacter sp.]